MWFGKSIPERTMPELLKPIFKRGSGIFSVLMKLALRIADNNMNSMCFIWNELHKVTIKRVNDKETGMKVPVYLS